MNVIAMPTDRGTSNIVSRTRKKITHLRSWCIPTMFHGDSEHMSTPTLRWAVAPECDVREWNMNEVVHLPPFQDPPLGLTEHCWKDKTVPPTLVQAFPHISPLFAYIHSCCKPEKRRASRNKNHDFVVSFIFRADFQLAILCRDDCDKGEIA